VKISQQSIPVLLLEDEPVLARHIGDVLEKIGHQVLAAADAAEALRVSAQHRPQFALLNFRLTHTCDGMALAQHLHRQYGTQVVFVTGARTQDLAASEHYDSKWEVLQKPFTRGQLERVLGKGSLALQIANP